MKRLDSGVVRMKGELPGGLEVNGIGQDQTRGRGQYARFDQVRDFVPRLPGHPGVDGEAGGFEGVDEVQVLDVALVHSGDGLLIVVPEGDTLLEPKGIGEGDQGAFMVIRGVEAG